MINDINKLNSLNKTNELKNQNNQNIGDEFANMLMLHKRVAKRL